MCFPERGGGAYPPKLPARPAPGGVGNRAFLRAPVWGVCVAQSRTPRARVCARACVPD